MGTKDRLGHALRVGHARARTAGPLRATPEVARVPSPRSIETDVTMSSRSSRSYSRYAATSARSRPHSSVTDLPPALGVGEGCRSVVLGRTFPVSDPRQGAAHLAGSRAPRWARAAAWSVSVVFWAIASDARPLLALLSLIAAWLIRVAYVVTTRSGNGRAVLWSAWFFAIAAICELAWLLERSTYL